MTATPAKQQVAISLYKVHGPHRRRNPGRCQLGPILILPLWNQVRQDQAVHRLLVSLWHLNLHPSRIHSLSKRFRPLKKLGRLPKLPPRLEIRMRVLHLNLSSSVKKTSLASKRRRNRNLPLDHGEAEVPLSTLEAQVAGNAN